MNSGKYIIGQLISEGKFGVFKRPKKQRTCFEVFLPQLGALGSKMGQIKK